MINGTVFGSLSPLWDAGLVGVLCQEGRCSCRSSWRSLATQPFLLDLSMTSFFFSCNLTSSMNETRRIYLDWRRGVDDKSFFFKKAPHLVGVWVPAEELSSAISGCRSHLQGLSVAARRFPILAKELPSSCRHPPEEDPDAAASVVKQQDMQYLYPTVVWILLLYFCCWWLFSGLGKHLIPFICMPAFSVVWNA